MLNTHIYTSVYDNAFNSFLVASITNLMSFKVNILSSGSPPSEHSHLRVNMFGSKWTGSPPTEHSHLLVNMFTSNRACSVQVNSKCSAPEELTASKGQFAPEWNSLYLCVWYYANADSKRIVPARHTSVQAHHATPNLLKVLNINAINRTM